MSLALPRLKDWITADGLCELDSLYFPDELKDTEFAVISVKARVESLSSRLAGLCIQCLAKEM